MTYHASMNGELSNQGKQRFQKHVNDQKHGTKENATAYSVLWERGKEFRLNQVLFPDASHASMPFTAGKCTKAEQSTQKAHHKMTFEVCACDQSVCVRCVVANWFFLYSIDLQPLLHSCSYSDIERQRCRKRTMWETIILVEECIKALQCLREN